MGIFKDLKAEAIELLKSQKLMTIKHQDFAKKILLNETLGLTQKLEILELKGLVTVTHNKKLDTLKLAGPVTTEKKDVHDTQPKCCLGTLLAMDTTTSLAYSALLTSCLETNTENISARIGNMLKPVESPMSNKLWMNRAASKTNKTPAITLSFFNVLKELIKTNVQPAAIIIQGKSFFKLLMRAIDEGQGSAVLDMLMQELTYTFPDNHQSHLRLASFAINSSKKTREPYALLKKLIRTNQTLTSEVVKLLLLKTEKGENLFKFVLRQKMNPLPQDSVDFSMIALDKGLVIDFLEILMEAIDKGLASQVVDKLFQRDRWKKNFGDYVGKYMEDKDVGMAFAKIWNKLINKLGKKNFFKLTMETDKDSSNWWRLVMISVLKKDAKPLQIFAEIYAGDSSLQNDANAIKIMEKKGNESSVISKIKALGQGIKVSTVLSQIGFPVIGRKIDACDGAEDTLFYLDCELQEGIKNAIKYLAPLIEIETGIKRVVAHSSSEPRVSVTEGLINTFNTTLNQAKSKSDVGLLETPFLLLKFKEISNLQHLTLITLYTDAIKGNKTPDKNTEYTQKASSEMHKMHKGVKYYDKALSKVLEMLHFKQVESKADAERIIRDKYFSFIEDELSNIIKRFNAYGKKSLKTHEIYYKDAVIEMIFKLNVKGRLANENKLEKEFLKFILNDKNNIKKLISTKVEKHSLQTQIYKLYRRLNATIEWSLSSLFLSPKLIDYLYNQSEALKQTQQGGVIQLGTYGNA